MRSILHVADYAAPYSGNFIAEIRAIARVSERAGWRSALALPNTAANRDWVRGLRSDGIQVHLVPSPSRFLAAACTLAAIIRDQNVEIVHTHFNRRYEMAAALARLLSAVRGTRLVWHRRSDGRFRLSAATRLKNFIGNQILAGDARVIVLSDELRRQAISTGIQAERITGPFHGIDIARINAPGRSRAEVRSEWCVADNERIALMFGWDPDTKGVDLALRAAHKIGSSMPGFILVIVGWDATIRAAEAVLGRSRPNWLRIVPPTEDVADYYGAADLMLSSSRYEGFSGAMAEAMSAGLPVVATNIPGVQWAAASIGVHFAELNECAIASGLKQMLQSTPQQMAQWSEANRHLVTTKYSLEHMAKRVCELYVSMIRPTNGAELLEAEA